MAFSSFVWGVAVLLALGVGALQWYMRKTQHQRAKPTDAEAHLPGFTHEFSSFQQTYLIVYYLVMCADWLQGPYVYALYESYGYDSSDIAKLFITGFGSSMIFGTFVGSLADSYGRKKMAIAFGVLYSLSCMTKLSESFAVLMIGRLLSGISTSLLFSVFETWMIHEHHRLGFPEEWLSTTFSYAYLGNSIVAILSGFLASMAASVAGYVAPFMLSMILLIIATIIVATKWSESYGDINMDLGGSLRNAVGVLRSDSRIVLLGASQALFEAAMYVFVFLWTPALATGAIEFKSHNSSIHGLVFATFMVATMLGSSIFALASNKYTSETLGQSYLVVGSAALLIPTITNNAQFNMMAFTVFEGCCGLFFPNHGVLRSIYVPEDSRATIMNFFRVPLNLLVVLVLHFGSNLEYETKLAICAIWLGSGFLFIRRLSSAYSRPTRTGLTNASGH